MILILLIRTADVHLDMMPIERNSTYTKLYPVMLDTFRVVIVQKPKTMFNITRMFGAEEICFWVGTILYFCFNILAEKVLHRKGKKARTLYKIWCDVMDETSSQKLSHFGSLSVNLARSFFLIFVYVNYVTLMGKFIAFLTNSTTDPHITSLSTITNSSMDIVIPSALLIKYPNLTDLVR